MTESPFTKPGYDPDVRLNAEDRADVPRDGYGRYLVKLPGMEHMPSAPSVPLTRVSTITKALIQKRSLIDWRERLILEAFAGEPDDSPLLADLKRAKEQGNRKQIMAIGEELFKRGGGKERSQLGTAMHEYTEKRNRGEDPGSIPEEHRPSLEAYDAVLEGRVRVLPGFLERRLIAPWSAGGTLDNVVMYRNDLLQPEGADGDTPAPGEWDMRVADLKTGRDISKGWAEKVIQLWEYANAEYLWNEEEKRWERPPRELRKDRGLIIHVPMDGTANLYDVDLSGVDRVVEAAMIARRHEAEAHTRARIVGTADRRGPAFVAPVTQAGSMVVSTELLDRTASTDQAIAEAAHAEAQALIASTVTGAFDVPGQLVPPPIPQDHGLLTADGSGPLQPLAGEGKRGCGACGRTGHKRNSPKCWGENDPSTGKAAQVANQTKTAEQVRAEDPAGEYQPGAPDPAGGDQYGRDPEPQPSEMTNGAPHPTCPGHGAGWTNRGDGVWVCAQCGLPSAAVPTTVGEAVQAGQFPQPPGSVKVSQPEQVTTVSAPGPDGAPTVVRTPGPVLSVPAATVPDGWSDWVAEDLRQAKTIQALAGIQHLAWQRSAWKDEVHGVLLRDRATVVLYPSIDQATSTAEVLKIRDAAISFGAWIPEQHDNYGKNRYEALMMEGKR